MSEIIILDPVEESPGRAELDISSGPNIYVGEEGIAWDTAAVEPFSADQVRGSVPIGYRVPNRTITMALILQGSDAQTFDETRRLLQGKVSRIQQEGGVLKRQMTNGAVLYADLVDASLELPGGRYQATTDLEPAATLTLSALPDFYGAEVLAGTVSEASAPEATLVMADIEGDFPARTRIVVTDTEGENKKGILWSLRSRHYAADTTAAPAYEAQDLDLEGTAGVTAATGAHGGTAVQQAGFAVTSAMPVISWEDLTHEGNYRVFVRAAAPFWGPAVSLRLVWGVGDIRNPTRNGWWAFPAADNWYFADLGMVRLKPPPVGTHHWSGQIQVMGADDGSEIIQLDRVYILNVDDGYGVARSSTDTNAYGETIAHDDFSHDVGSVVTGTTLDGGGGTWAGAGDTTDYENILGALTRDAVSDTLITGGRLLSASGSAATAQIVRVDFTHPIAPVWDGTGTTAGFLQGIVARYTDANNWLVAGLQSRTFWASYGRMMIYKKVGGTISTVLAGDDGTFMGAYDFWWRCTFQVDANGTWAFNVSPNTAHVDEFTVSGYDADLATGGALASGKGGVYDANTDAAASTRVFESFDMVGYATDAAIYADLDAQLTTTGIFRKSVLGPYKRVASYEGDFPRLPPATADSRVSELLVKPSRGDFELLPDIGIDDLSVDVYYRPAWLITPADPPP